MVPLTSKKGSEHMFAALFVSELGAMAARSTARAFAWWVRLELFVIMNRKGYGLEPPRAAAGGAVANTP